MMTPTAVTNRDNDALLPFGPIGHVEAVNGPGAQELPNFVPTHDELLHLARHWMTELKTVHYRWFWWGHVGSDQIRVEPFALRRLSRIAALVGDAAVDQIAREVEEAIEPDPLSPGRLLVDEPHHLRSVSVLTEHHVGTAPEKGGNRGPGCAGCPAGRHRAGTPTAVAR